MAMVGDGMTSYDHEGDGKGNDIGSCTSQYANLKTPTRARVTYIHQQGLKVYVIDLSWNLMLQKSHSPPGETVSALSRTFRFL
jgi:Legume-like lectin family